jgi:hypothetical protein
MYHNVFLAAGPIVALQSSGANFKKPVEISRDQLK